MEASNFDVEDAEQPFWPEFQIGSPEFAFERTFQMAHAEPWRRGELRAARRFPPHKIQALALVQNFPM
jgi:hypothetical protein